MTTIISDSSLSSISIDRLEQELKDRKSTRVSELQKERNKIDQEIYKLSSKKNIVSMRKSAQRISGKPLETYILEIAADDKTRSPKDFHTDLTTSGWTTKSDKPYMMIASKLSNLEKSKKLERVSKGLYKIIK